jgi:hypothetical protein
MKISWPRAALLALALFAVMGWIVTSMAGRAVEMKKASSPVVQRFFERCRARDYQGAHAFFSPAERERFSLSMLRSRWEQFETGHGALQSWEIAQPRTGYATNANLWPAYVQTTYLMRGTKSFTVVQLRLVPRDEGWRIERMNIQR